MNKTSKILVLITFIFSTSCDPFFGYKYNQGSLPTMPINLSEFNTKYDDYNSSGPTLGSIIPFCFSTNRNSDGNEFDIIYKPMSVIFNKTTGILKVTNEYGDRGGGKSDYEIVRLAIHQIKTDGNEYGPNLVMRQGIGELDFTLLYSTDVTGNAQINFVSNITNESFTKPKEVEFLNSEFDDMYPTFNADKSKIYFCSNRNGENFDFYHIDVNTDKDIELLLSENISYDIKMDTTLSSSADDKCPFIFEDMLVFASNREGGFGGYDLYYCNRKSRGWSEPINFGEGINTKFDEFRPILINEGVTWTQTMMVFSSNRTGGFGGFDLYFVGIDNE